MSQETSGPWVAIAVICETALQEASGVLSLIRVVDRFQVAGPTSEMQPVNLKFTIVVAFKAGFSRNSAIVSIKPIPPSNKDVPPIEASVLFEGEDRGVNLVLNIPGFQVSEQGLYWFDVSVDGVLFTRIPLRIMYQKVSGTMPGLPGLPPNPGR
jgi:hypothetical protein